MGGRREEIPGELNQEALEQEYASLQEESRESLQKPAGFCEKEVTGTGCGKNQGFRGGKVRRFRRNIPKQNGSPDFSAVKIL